MLAVFVALWCVLAAALRSMLADPRNPANGGPDGAPAYDPTAAAAAAASSSSAGPDDIWGLGTKQDALVLFGIAEPPLSATKAAPGFYRANEVAQPKAPKPPEQGYGPQSKTALEAMQELPKLYATNRAGYIALQQKLFRAGFYGSAAPQSIGIGAYNQQTVDAYRKAILNAVQISDSGTPVTFDEMLDDNVAAHKNDPRQVQPGFISQFSDPQTVAAIAQQAAQSTLGRNLTTAEVKSFVAEFHQQEVAYNQSRKTAETTAATGKDAAVNSAPDASAAANEFVQQGTRGTEASGNRLADYVGVIRGLVGGNT